MIELCSIAHDKLLEIIFLIETKVEVARMEYVKRRLAFNGCFSTDAIGRKGEFSLLWKEKSGITIFNFS